jgi:Electron transfer DM13
MKAVYSLFFVGCFFMMSCKKEHVPAYGNEIIVTPVDTQTVVLYSGVLIGGEMGDRARGDVTIEKVGSKHYLVFKNFSSYNGPDVHVYFSKTIGNNANPPLEYVDLGFLKYLSGNFNYELAAKPDVAIYRYVLVWCARYRIQFGYTELN